MVWKVPEGTCNRKPDIFIGVAAVSNDDGNASLVIEVTKSSNPTVENHCLGFAFQQFNEKREDFVAEKPIGFLR